MKRIPEKYYEKLSKLIYFKEGKPYWNCDRAHIKRGTMAGHVRYGYRTIGTTIDRKIKCVLAHRLHWYMVNGDLPEFLDHINRCRDDNRIENLRPATRAQNNRNSGPVKGSTSKYKGVSLVRGKYIAQIRLEGKNRHIGSYITEDAAALAYNLVAEKHYGEFAVLNDLG